MKKVLTSLLVIFFALLSFTPSSFAASDNNHSDHEHHEPLINPDDNNIVEKNGDVELMYIPCPGGGKHNMTRHANGKVIKNGKVVLKNGIVWQCSKCYEVIISSLDPRVSGKLGKYGVENPGFRLRTGFIMDNPSYVGENSSVKGGAWDSYIWGR